jgi:hypothetical protein
MSISKKKSAPSATTLDTKLEPEEMVDDLDEALEVIPYTYSITAYGADYPVDSVVKRIEAQDTVCRRTAPEAFRPFL